MDSYEITISQMAIHFVSKYPKRKNPAMVVSFEGEDSLYKVATFKDELTMRWFIGCLDEALKCANDFQSRLRGTWIKWKQHRFTAQEFGYECNICHTIWDRPSNFCPHCGAKMAQSE